MFFHSYYFHMEFRVALNLNVGDFVFILNCMSSYTLPNWNFYSVAFTQDVKQKQSKLIPFLLQILKIPKFVFTYLPIFSSKNSRKTKNLSFQITNPPGVHWKWIWWRFQFYEQKIALLDWKHNIFNVNHIIVAVPPHFASLVR